MDDVVVCFRFQQQPSVDRPSKYSRTKQFQKLFYQPIEDGKPATLIVESVGPLPIIVDAISIGGKYFLKRNDFPCRFKRNSKLNLRGLFSEPLSSDPLGLE